MGYLIHILKTVPTLNLLDVTLISRWDELLMVVKILLNGGPFLICQLLRFSKLEWVLCQAQKLMKVFHNLFSLYISSLNYLTQYKIDERNIFFRNHEMWLLGEGKVWLVRRSFFNLSIVTLGTFILNKRLVLEKLWVVYACFDKH